MLGRSTRVNRWWRQCPVSWSSVVTSSWLSSDGVVAAVRREVADQIRDRHRRPHRRRAAAAAPAPSTRRRACRCARGDRDTARRSPRRPRRPRRRSAHRDGSSDTSSRSTSRMPNSRSSSACQPAITRSTGKYPRTCLLVDRIARAGAAGSTTKPDVPRLEIVDPAVRSPRTPASSARSRSAAGLRAPREIAQERRSPRRALGAILVASDQRDRIGEAEQLRRLVPQREDARDPRRRCRTRPRSAPGPTRASPNAR